MDESWVRVAFYLAGIGAGMVLSQAFDCLRAWLRR